VGNTAQFVTPPESCCTQVLTDAVG
jgi:hypothetical protein